MRCKKLWILNISNFLLNCVCSGPLWPSPPSTGPFRDCFHVRKAGHGTSGMYLLKTNGSDQLIQAWCEHGLDNGGWTVLQRRKDGSVNFFRNWENYKVSPSSGKKLGFNSPERLQRETLQWKKCHLIFKHAVRFALICCKQLQEKPLTEAPPPEYKCM